MTPAELLPLARLCAAAYEPGDEAVLGLGLADDALRFGTDACMALVLHAADRDIVAWQGTRVDPAVVDLAEIWCDLDGAPLATPRGIVHAGFWAPLPAVWTHVARVLRPGLPLLITGHSLGGTRAHLSAALVDDGRPVQVVSFGAPACARAEFWGGLPAPVRIVHERDFAPGWPPVGGWTHPHGRMLWLRDGSADLVDARGGINASLRDHAIEAYVAALTALAA